MRVLVGFGWLITLLRMEPSAPAPWANAIVEFHALDKILGSHSTTQTPPVPSLLVDSRQVLCH